MNEGRRSERQARIENITAGRLPVTERVSSQVLCLPFYSEMTEAMLDGMCKAIERIQRYSQEVKTCLRA